MSRNFGNYQLKTYLVPTYTAPFKANADAGIVPKIVPINVRWTDYFATLTQQIGININLDAQQGTPLEQILSIWIDNLSNTSPVYVIFPDTNFVVKCAANSQVLAPVITAGRQMQLLTDNIQSGNTTRIFACNVPARFWDIDGDTGVTTGKLITGPDGTVQAVSDVMGELTVNGSLNFATGNQYYVKVLAAQSLNASISKLIIKTLKVSTANVFNGGNDALFTIGLTTAPANTIAFGTLIVQNGFYAPQDRSGLQANVVIDLDDQYLQISSGVDVYLIVIPSTAPQVGSMYFYAAYTYI